MAIAVISVTNGLPVRAAAAPFGYPVTVSSNGFGLGVTPVASGGWPVFDTSGTLFGPPVIPANITLPVIFGTPQVGYNLVSSSGTWSGTAATYTYQWKRGGVNIAGATSNPYLVVTADIGAMITVTVTATNGAGSASATSAAVGPILSGVPVNTVLPVISGTPTVGQTLTTTDGTWTGTPTITYTYQWYQGNSLIGGATSNTYVIQPIDIGEMFVCVVRATNVAGNTIATSNSLGPIAATGTGPTPPVMAMDAGWTGTDTTPDFMITVDNTVVAGDSLRLQIQLSSGGWTSLVDDVLHLITSGEDSANLITLATGALSNGNYQARTFVIDVTTGASLPSNVVSFTVTGGTSSAATYYILGF